MVRGSKWALTGTWGLMAGEELLEELCHFTAGLIEGLSYIQDLSCVSDWLGYPDRNVSHTDDVFLLLYRAEWELDGGCSLGVKT